MQLFRVVEAYTQTNRDPLQIVNVQALKASLRDVERATLITAELLTVTGIADVIQDNFSVLADGLNVEDLPEADLEMLRRTGSSDPRMEANALIYQTKARKEQTIREGRETSFAQRIRDIPNQIKRLHDELPSDSTGKPEPPRQPRRWFKGVGGIIKGSIFVLVDGAIATGIWSLPLPVQASTVGIVYSFAEGIGTLFTSAGELRRE
jgi:hypothetical protein